MSTCQRLVKCILVHYTEIRIRKRAVYDIQDELSKRNQALCTYMYMKKLQKDME